MKRIVLGLVAAVALLSVMTAPAMAHAAITTAPTIDRITGPMCTVRIGPITRRLTPIRRAITRALSGLSRTGGRASPRNRIRSRNRRAGF